MSYRMEVKGDKLVLTIDITKELYDAAPPSSSGKTRLLASSGGFIGNTVPGIGTVKLAFNATV